MGPSFPRKRGIQDLGRKCGRSDPGGTENPERPWLTVSRGQRTMRKNIALTPDWKTGLINAAHPLISRSGGIDGRP